MAIKDDYFPFTPDAHSAGFDEMAAVLGRPDTSPENIISRIDRELDKSAKTYGRPLPTDRKIDFYYGAAQKAAGAGQKDAARELVTKAFNLITVSEIRANNWGKAGFARLFYLLGALNPEQHSLGEYLERIETQSELGEMYPYARSGIRNSFLMDEGAKRQLLANMEQLYGKQLGKLPRNSTTKFLGKVAELIGSIGSKGKKPGASFVDSQPGHGQS